MNNDGMEEKPADKQESIVNFPIAVKFGLAQILLSFLPLSLISALLFFEYEGITKDALGLIDQNTPGVETIRDKVSALHVNAGFLFGFFIILLFAGTLMSVRLLTGPLKKLVGWIQNAHQKKFVDVAAAPIISNDEVGQLTYEINESIKYFREIGEREKAISKAKTEFISIAAHQLRTPLTSTLWAWNSLASQEIEQKDAPSVIQIGLAATKQMMNLVNSLLNVSSIEEGRFGFTFRKIEICALIEQAVNEFRPLAEVKKIKIDYVKPVSPSTVYADTDRINTVLNNLLSNAIHYTLPGGSIAVRINHRDDKVEISVEDAGVGMTPEEQERLFTKFFRSKEAVLLHPDGSGLGLFIVKNIVARHGGTIQVKSRPGRGSTFTFSLSTKQIEKKEVPFEQFFSSF